MNRRGGITDFRRNTLTCGPFGLRLIALSALFITACTNGQSVIGLGAGNNANSAANGSNDSLGTGFVTLQEVNTDPNVSGTLDLVGDGSNSIGTNCTAATTTTGTPSADYQGAGASNCQCEFTYAPDPTNLTDTENVFVNTTYYEANMIECPYNQVPATATSVTVAIYNSTTQQTSNSVVFPLTGVGAAVDLTNPINFAQMSRYQCKDIVTIMMPWADGQPTTAANVMYDPFQSSDPDISYPLNFYTINYGGTFSQIAQNQITNWSCPGLPNDPSVPGLDLRIWSWSPDSAGSSQIYPPVGSAFDRSTFYVSKQQAGVFTVPVNTYIAPTLYGGNGTLPPSGYAAAPIAGATAGTETCPVTTNMPTGYQWAKLWLFRAGLTDRYFTTSAAIESTNVQCNPGYATGSATPLFNDCGSLGGVTLSGTSGIPSTGATSPGVQLADRIISGEGSSLTGAPASTSAVCVNLDGSSDAGGFACALNETTEGPGCWTGTETTARYAAGTDLWNPRRGAATNTSGAPAGEGVILDPLNLYSTPKNTSGTNDVPVDVAPGTQDLDEVNGVSQSRYDYVFVVSPATVMSGEMGVLNPNQLNPTASYPYYPLRFPSKQDCQSSNPNSPSFSGDCNPQKIIRYGIVSNDISVPPNSQNAISVYPMCVLQPL